MGGSGVEVRVLLAGGGTGGHLMPALAVVKALRDLESEVQVMLCGSPRQVEREIVARSGVVHGTTAARPLSSRPLDLLRFPLALTWATLQGAAICRSFRPGVVLGLGGYASAGPILAAVLLGRPVLLLEPNVRPGKATRVLAKLAREVAVAFPETGDRLRARRVEVTGTPVGVLPPGPDREEVLRGWGLNPEQATVLILGGSQGATPINRAATAHLRASGSPLPYNVVVQTGARDEGWVRAELSGTEPALVRPFFEDLRPAYSVADLVVARAGASTVAELLVWGLPAILIPSPVSGGHQRENAVAVARRGAALCLPQAELSPDRLGELIAGLLADRDRREAISRTARSMARPEAATRVAERVLALAREWGGGSGRGEMSPGGYGRGG